jgi:hypothetical protein
LKIWECKIGEVESEKVPDGADFPMRRAVEAAYFQITGQRPDFIFSGWAGELSEVEREAVERS